MNPHFRRLVIAVRSRGLKVIDRCNLTILEEPGFDRPLYGSQLHGIFVKALLIHYDTRFWLESFLLNWPEGSPA